MPDKNQNSESDAALQARVVSAGTPDELAPVAIPIRPTGDSSDFLQQNALLVYALFISAFFSIGWTLSPGW